MKTTQHNYKLSTKVKIQGTNRMRKRVLQILFIIITFFLFTDCSKDIDLVTDYQDDTIVYCILDPNDSISYIRIQKGFLTEDDIFQAAQIQDSIEYPYKLDVKIKSGSNIITFDTVTLFNKEEGVFSAPKTRVYYAVTKDLLSTNEPTLLEIYNPVLKKTISSVAYLSNSNTIEYAYPSYSINFEDDETISFDTKKNAKIYDFTIRFHYMELDPRDSTSMEYLYIDWVFQRYITSSTDGGETVQHFIEGQIFYDFLSGHIEETNTKNRYYGQIELIINSTDNSFNAFQEANNNEESIIIDKPQFTNINNGLGLFASQSTGSRFFNMSIYTKFHIKRIPGLRFIDGIPEDLYSE